MPAKLAGSHRERLLRAGLRLFYLHGFTGTRVDALLAEAGVPKGSFYHHFGSKESFAIAVLDRYDEHQAAALRTWAERNDLSVVDRVAGYHRAVIDGFVASGWEKACLLGKLSNEVASHSEPLRDRMTTSFDVWRRSLSDLLAEGQANGDVIATIDADDLAMSVLVLIEGGFVAALTRRERDHLDAVTDALVDLLTPAGSAQGAA